MTRIRPRARPLMTDTPPRREQPRLSVKNLSSYDTMRNTHALNELDNGRHRTGFRRASLIAAIVVPVLYALVINLNALNNPPAWDSAVTVSPAAITIVDMDFDVWEVAQLPSSPDGGPNTHSTSIYTIGLALLIFLLGASNAFYVAHLFSIALVGALAAGTYLLSRERASIPVSAVAAAAVSIVPLVVQQAADVYIDLPLAVVGTFACWTACRRWFWRTAALVLVGVAVKTSGVFLLPLLLFARPVDKALRRHLAHAVGSGLIAILPFLLALATTHRFAGGTRNPLVTWPLLRSSASLLVITTDVFIILAVYLVVTYGRARSGLLDRVTGVSAIVVAGFFAAHVATMLLSGTIAILPRYYIVILPAVLATLLPIQQDAGTRRSQGYLLGVGFVIALAGFSLLNVQGNFYPRPNDDFYVIAERSTRAQTLLELQMLGTKELVDTNLPVLVERQVYFQLEYPEMGYVDETPELVIPVFFEPLDDMPEEFAMLMERRVSNPLVPFEERAPDLGYELEYSDLTVGPFRSQLIIASR